MVRSTGIFPMAMDSGASELATSTFTPWDNFVRAPTMAPISIVCETTLKSGITVIGATSMGSMAMGFLESPDTLADMGF